MAEKDLYINDLIHRFVTHTFTETTVNSMTKVEFKAVIILTGVPKTVQSNVGISFIDVLHDLLYVLHSCFGIKVNLIIIDKFSNRTLPFVYFIENIAQTMGNFLQFP